MLGIKATLLKGTNSIVISKALSDSFFGENSNPLGKAINITQGEEGIDEAFTVSGVFEVPKHSSENFDFLLSYTKYLELRNPNYIHGEVIVHKFT